ncbi:MAG TPA: hypothetical protein VKP69_18875 [Isosphaeraceae bacterium]|nr:hypothetical protein [Isosphaeraceae bacterium]
MTLTTPTPTRGALGPAELPALPLIRATDLAHDPRHRPLWDPGASGAPATPAPSDLPRPGFASPLGFWLAEADEAALGPSDRTTIRFEAYNAPPPAPRPLPPGAARRPEQTVRLKPPSVGDGELILKIGPSGARIVTSEAAWKALAEPVLLAIGLYWRFQEVDERLDRLSEAARGDLGHATMPGLATLKDRDRLNARARSVRDLVVDLPHFQGPLTDAFPYCSTELSAQTFEALAEKLHFEDWGARLDERAEAVEDTYEAIGEKLLEFQNFAWEAILELLIVVILLGELALTIYEMFGPD